MKYQERRHLWKYVIKNNICIDIQLIIADQLITKKYVYINNISCESTRSVNSRPFCWCYIQERVVRDWQSEGRNCVYLSVVVSQHDNSKSKQDTFCMICKIA